VACPSPSWASSILRTRVTPPLLYLFYFFFPFLASLGFYLFLDSFPPPVGNTFLFRSQICSIFVSPLSPWIPYGGRAPTAPPPVQNLLRCIFQLYTGFLVYSSDACCIVGRLFPSSDSIPFRIWILVYPTSPRPANLFDPSFDLFSPVWLYPWTDETFFCVCSFFFLKLSPPLSTRQNCTWYLDFSSTSFSSSWW